MKVTRFVVNLLMTLLLVIGFAACGGSDTTAPPPPAGGGMPLAPSACTSGSYALYLSSYSGPVTGDPRIMNAFLTCRRGSNAVAPSPAAGVPIDWAVTAGGGSIGGQTTARTVTDANGSATVTWDFGSGGDIQSFEARYNDVSSSVRASVSYTVLVPGPNRCAAAGGTDLGIGRTISSNETWTQAASPYFTTCPVGVACSGEVLLTNGAVLTIEPGTTICVNKILARDAGRIVAIGTAGEPIYFGVRSRADHWKGLDLQAPAIGASMSGASVLTHAVIENATDVNVAAHPIIVEDTLMRRVVPAAYADHCAVFSIEQHAVGGLDPSSVRRTVIDGLGDSGGGDDYFACPALNIRIANSFPLNVSVRVINSRGRGVFFNNEGLGPADLNFLYDCEISGSVFDGLGAYVFAPFQVIGCNIFGNLGPGVINFGELPLEARDNWWGDPVGPQGPNGDGVLGDVDARSPLAAPMDLGY